jgi:hypothetical protein
MFQYMNDEETRMFLEIIEKHFPGMFDEAYLNHMRENRLKG